MSLSITTKRFGDSPDNADYPGDRGIVVETETGYSGIGLSSHLPDVWVSDNGFIEFAEQRMTLEDFREWTEAVLASEAATDVAEA